MGARLSCLSSRVVLRAVTLDRQRAPAGASLNHGRSFSGNHCSGMLVSLQGLSAGPPRRSTSNCYVASNPFLRRHCYSGGWRHCGARRMKRQPHHSTKMCLSLNGPSRKWTHRSDSSSCPCKQCSLRKPFSKKCPKIGSAGSRSVP